MQIDRRAFSYLLASALWRGAPAAGQNAPLPRRPPNFVLLLADDLGYGDLGCYGNTVIRTPNIDRLAADGVRFTDFYATPTCSPSRAALLTGRYPIRSGLTRVLIPGEHFGIPDSEVTLAEALKRRGYHTACIGKWHLGNRPAYRPNRHGFDHFYGLHYSNDMTLPVVRWPILRLFRDNQVVEAPVRQTTLTRRFTAEAVRFIENHRRDPFFLYLPYTMPHRPWSASRNFAGKSAHGRYGDAVEEMDWSVGEISRTLARTGIDDNTVVLFLSDNGPELLPNLRGGSAGIFRGGKASTWEGGVRVPCVARWPAGVPSGVVRMGITCLMDLYATILELAQADVPEDYIVDGRSLITYLRGETPCPRSTYFYYRKSELFAVRHGEWKLHFMKVRQGRQGLPAGPAPCEPLELYNLESDPGEKRNLEAHHPEIVAQLTELTAGFRESLTPGPHHPPRWRSVLPRIGFGRKKN